MGPIVYNCVVINYNNLDILCESIPLLLADGLGVVVVDNGSDDGSREYLAGCKGILAILNDDNLGSSRPIVFPSRRRLLIATPSERVSFSSARMCAGTQAAELSRTLRTAGGRRSRQVGPSTSA